MAMPKFDTVDAYVAHQPTAVREQLERLRALLHEAAPGSEEAISYGMPTLKRAGRNLIHFAAWKAHLSLYPASGTVVAKLGKALDGFHVAKGTIQLPLGSPLDLKLIRLIVKVRAAEIDAVAGAPGAKPRSVRKAAAKKPAPKKVAAKKVAAKKPVAKKPGGRKAIPKPKSAGKRTTR